jgi:uncharacterized damage-inducible protein DinB
MLLQTLLDHDSWANREMITALEAGTTERATRWMAHILAAEVLWSSRIRGEVPGIAVWPEIDLDECRTIASQLPQRWRSILEEYPGEKMSTVIPYTNSMGEDFSNTVEQMILQVVTHSSYHRGQIVSDLREAGFAPVYTDYIHAVRQGFVK